MRILIPTVDDRGDGSAVSDHFGRAPFFAIADTATGQVTVAPNGAMDHGSGGCAPVTLVGGGGLAEAVVCRGIGRRALAELTASNVRVFVSGGADVAAVLADHRAGRLVEATAERRHADGADGCGGSPDCNSPHD